MGRYKAPRKLINYSVSILHEFNVAAAFAQQENTPRNQMIARIEALALKLNPLATREAANKAAAVQGRVLTDELLLQRAHRYTYGGIGKGQRRVESNRVKPADLVKYAVIRSQETGAALI
jgi:hypothetical protein